MDLADAAISLSVLRGPPFNLELLEDAPVPDTECDGEFSFLSPKGTTPRRMAVLSATDYGRGKRDFSMFEITSFCTQIGIDAMSVVGALVKAGA